MEEETTTEFQDPVRRNMQRLSASAAKGPTRRLPTWMPASPAIVTSTNVAIQRECRAASIDAPQETDEQCSTLCTEDEPRRQWRTKSDGHKKLVSTGIGCRKRGRKQKSSKEAGTHDGDDDVMLNSGKDDEFRRKCQGQVPRRRRNVTVNSRQVDGASDTTSLQDDVIELTVEDLVTLAEENIRSYDDALQPLGESTLECGGRLAAPENANGSHNHASVRTEKSSECGVPEPGKAIEDLSNEEVFAGTPNKNSDSAGEMLDLLLGPLLKKSVR